MKRKGFVKVDHYPEISEEDLHKLYSNDTKVFDANTPYSLQRKVWFEIMLYLCRRGQENLRIMKKDTFRVGVDASGLKYVYQFCKRANVDKNHRVTANPSDIVTEGRMYKKKSKL